MAGEAAILDSFFRERSGIETYAVPELSRAERPRTPEVKEGIQISKNGMIEAGEGGARREEIVSEIFSSYGPSLL